MKSLDAKKLREQYGPTMLSRLKWLTTNNPGVQAAQICTVDGFEIVAVHRDEESRRRLAAMASSMHALGSALVQEVGLGDYVNLVVEGTEGKVLMMSVPGSAGALLLTAVASQEALFGHFHYVCKACCESLREQVPIAQAS